MGTGLNTTIVLHSAHMFDLRRRIKKRGKQGKRKRKKNVYLVAFFKSL